MIKKSHQLGSTPPSKRYRGIQQEQEKEVHHKVLSQRYGLITPPKRKADQFESQSEFMNEQQLMKVQKKKLQSDCKKIEQCIQRSEKGLSNLRQQYKSQEEKQFKYQLQKTRIENRIQLKKKEDQRLRKKKVMNQEQKIEISDEIQRIWEIKINLIQKQQQKQKEKNNQIQMLLNEKKVQQLQLQLELNNANNEDKKKIQIQLFRLSFNVKKLEEQCKDVNKQRLLIQKIYDQKRQNALDQKQSSLNRLTKCFSSGSNIELTNSQRLQSTRFFQKYKIIQDYRQQLKEIQNFFQKKQRLSKNIQQCQIQLARLKQDYQTTKNKLKQVDKKIINLRKKPPIKSREQYPPTIQPTTNRYVPSSAAPKGSQQSKKSVQ